MNNKEKYKAVNHLVEKINDEELTDLSKFLSSRISCPDTYAVMLGETSSGKSTLINGLIGEEILYTSVRPSTGSIVEIAFTNKKNEPDYFAINKNATMEKLTEKEFISLSKKPDNHLNRLRINVEPKIPINGALRLFDTPGYGSLVEEHEEILLDFLPESNLIIYVVAYKVGIQKDDIDFLNFVHEVISDETEFILVINRVPEDIRPNDSRIKEIKEYVSDFLHYSPKTIKVANEQCDDEYPLPASTELWTYIEEKINSVESRERLEKSFDSHIMGLFQKCESNIMRKKRQVEISVEENKKLKNIIKDLQNTGKDIKENMIEPRFTDLIEEVSKKLDKAKASIKNKIFERIDSSSKMQADEVLVYVNTHMLAFETKKQIDEIKSYIEETLNELDREIDDKLNVAIAKVEQTIELEFNEAFVKMSQNIFKRSGGKVLEQSLLNYFKQFAGAGGTGIANASKHLLKKFGDLFGKTFSRETHNQLASTLSKIGLTSVKAVSVGVTAIMDTVLIITDLMTWQNKLKKATDKGIEAWYDQLVSVMINDLQELKYENLRLIDIEIDMWSSEFDMDVDPIGNQNIVELMNSLESVRKKISIEGVGGSE